MGRKSVFIPTKGFIERKCVNCDITFYVDENIIKYDKKRGRVCSYVCNIKSMKRRKRNNANIDYSHVIKHGKSRTGTYHTWQGMKTRCHNKNSYQYHLYGERGIKVCDRWLESFENFLEDMGERPENKTLDRIDVNGNYTPENCRWATFQEQNENRRNTIRIKSRGINETIRYWSEKTGISRHTILCRYKRGLPAKDILSTKKLKARKRL